MAAIRVLVLRAPGINCDDETAFIWEQVGAMVDVMHVQRLTEEPSVLDGYQVLTIPGGFSYGDDIASGRILGNQLRFALGDMLTRFIDRGGLVLGICNGFQVLVRLGLVPGADSPCRATLTWNASGRYEARWVHARAEVDHCPFLRAGEQYHLPVAHAEGRIVIEDSPDAGVRLTEARRIALRYTTADGSPVRFPENPNGSIENAAGLTDSTGRVLGLMPHPERNIFAHHDPAGVAPASPATADSAFHCGRRLFENAVAALR